MVIIVKLKMCLKNTSYRTQRRLPRGILCPKFNKQAGWPRRKNGAAASLGGSGLK
jgi:hypothetical protein